MSGLFDIASSGIQAYREAMAVTGQNIANINTEGYRRRGVDLSEITASQNDVTTISDQTGLGVRVEGISRAFDSFITGRARDSSSDFAQADAYKAALDSLESAIVPGDYDIGYFLGAFFDGLNGVAQAPADLASRTVALTQGKALAEAFVRLSQELGDLREAIWTQTTNVTRDLNSLLTTLQNTQKQLIASGSTGGASNAILDARDQTISEIGALVGVAVTGNASGAATVTLGRSGNGPLLGSATQTGMLQVRQGDDRLIFLAGQSPGLTETQQVSSGQLAGLSEAYLSISASMRTLDDLAARLATEFNQLHTMGIDLNGEIGGAMFSADGVSIAQSPTNLGRFTATASAPNVIDQIAGDTRFSYSSQLGAWLSFDAAGNATTHGAKNITLGSVRIDVTGTPADGDEFTLRAAIGSAAQMRFLLTQPQDIAAAGLLLSEADIGNSSNAIMSVSAVAPPAPTGLTDLTLLLKNDLSALSATTLRQNGVLGVIPAGTGAVDLVSMGRQDNVRFSLTEAQTVSATTLEITIDGETYTFKLTDDFTAKEPAKDTGDLAAWLNIGRLTATAKSDETNEFSFSDLGLFAAGSGGNLTIARSSSNGAITAATIDGLALVAGSVTNGLSDASNIQVFTRDGRQIAGTSLSQADVLGLLTEANGFLPQAEYRADFLNGADGVGYRGMAVERRTTTGGAVLSFSAAGAGPHLQLDAAAAVPSGPAGTVSLTIGTEIETIHIPAGLSASQIAARINAASADTGLRAAAATRLALSVIPNDQGPFTVQFTLEARNETPIQISADFTDGSMGNLLAAINAHSGDTGVVATAGLTPDRIVLVSEAGDDLVLDAISASGGSFTAIPVSADGATRDVDVALGGENGATALRIGGDIMLQGSLPFSLDWQSENIISTNDAFVDGLMTRQLDAAGRWQDIEFHLTDGLDTAEANPEGLGAIAAATQLSLTLGGNNNTAALAVTLDSGTLDALGSVAVAEALATKLRNMGMVPTLEGAPLIDLPTEGTIVKVLLGSQSYTLTMSDGEIAVSGPEAGRVTAFFDEEGVLRVAATAGSLSGQILRLSPETPAVDATAFGLGCAGASAALNGRTVTEKPAPANESEFILPAVIDGEEIDLDFGPLDNLPVKKSAEGYPNLSIEINTTDGKWVAKLVVKAENDGTIPNVRLRPSIDAEALGLISADSEITITQTGLRIAATDSAPVALDGTATGLVSERLSLRGLPAEELIVITTGTGARKIAAAFGEVLATPPFPAAYELRVVDGAARQVEVIDRGSGHSLATRSVGADGSVTAYGMRFDLEGVLTTGDRFYVRANQDGSGDARNAVALFALGDQNARTGLGGFAKEFGALVTQTGAQTRAAEIARDAAEARRDATFELEAEYSGVNLDDEAARLLEQQQAYQALARVLRTASDLLDTLLNAID
ncbi:MAG: flagellar hook-associated protein FlgK [Marivivens sp.]